MKIFRAHTPELVVSGVTSGENIMSVRKINPPCICSAAIIAEIKAVANFRFEFFVFIFFEKRFCRASPNAKIGNIRLAACKPFIWSVDAAGSACAIVRVGKIIDGKRPKMKGQTGICKHG